eukprot:CAMPEP_0206548794 /NCGR_PEP_ID=MMETSP0325_2-20121206/14090_1 /ASSEMBLY_ACC=CAM_ASM_000347 /TAXON_ID=2866 /ORGANISM="Crypthecodinium cohnii, Strain Seligo" /LENGTH=135 /DNA_ID=CAMNT_0054048331 /DNA_START=534 /DNA_END=942 /DNA_ORIENTATION=+
MKEPTHPEREGRSAEPRRIATARHRRRNEVLSFRLLSGRQGSPSPQARGAPEALVDAQLAMGGRQVQRREGVGAPALRHEVEVGMLKKSQAELPVTVYCSKMKGCPLLVVSGVDLLWCGDCKLLEGRVLINTDGF